MIICFDLDNVICSTINKHYRKAKPIIKTIKLINEAYRSGFKIVIFTGRFYGRCKGNLKKIIKMDNDLTKKQLKKWKVKYHSLLFGKQCLISISTTKILNLEKIGMKNLINRY